MEGLAENSDNEGLVDELEDLELDEDELLEARTTHVRGSGAQEEEDEMETPEDEDRDAPGAASTKLHDLTMHMLGLSASIWHSAQDSGNPEARERRRRMEETVGSVRDHERALRAGKAGLKKQKQDAGHAGLVGGHDAEVGDVQAGGAPARIYSKL